MKRAPLRSGLITAALLIALVAGWLYLAPTQLGGSTAYVVTKGNSMSPLFHSGDLAIVRPAHRYRVGQIVAYHSTLLHVVVLHRLIAVNGNTYVFKGDHNSFVDPVQPVRSELVGALWVHVPQAGRILLALHSPLVAALVAALAGVVLLGAREKRRRRRRRRRADAAGSGGERTDMASIRDRGLACPTSLRALFIGAAVVAAAFLGVGLLAFASPTRTPATRTIRYTHRVKLGYGASARAGPVYPDGLVRTGDPIFLRLVHKLRLQIDYRLWIAASHQLSGSETVLLRVANSAGWSRSVRLAAPHGFAGDHFTTEVTLDVPRLQALLQRVQALTGAPGGGGTIAVTPDVRISGTIAGQPVKISYSPAVSFQLTPLQLQVVGSGDSRGLALGAMAPSRQSTVALASSTAATLGVGGAQLRVAAVRWISFFGLLLAGACAIVLRVLLKVARSLEEVARIHARYGDLIVPVSTEAAVLDVMPFDVQSIEDLVRLARSGERLILHHREGLTDTYLVNDDVSVYRYRVDVPVMWGEWSPPRQTQVRELGDLGADSVTAG